MTESQNTAAPAFSLAGKWQVPLLALGVLACGLAAWYWVSSAPDPQWEDQLGAVARQLESTGGSDFTAVENAAKELLQHIPAQRTAECTGQAYALLGEIRWRSMKANGDWSTEQFQMLQQHYHRALEICQLPASAEQAERLGRAYEAIGQSAKAVQWYDRAVREDPARQARLDWRVIELALQDRSLTGEDLLARLLVYMRAEGLDADSYGIALERSIDLLLDARRPDRADTLIADERLLVAALPEPATFNRHVEFGQARVWARRGWTEQADNHLIQLIPELPPASALYAKANLLRGQLIRQDNPVQAEQLFRNVTANSPRTPMAIAAAAGLARAYADLHRYDKALEQYAAALEGLLEQPDNPYVHLTDMREALVADRQALMDAARPMDALGFARAERGLFDLKAHPFTPADQVETLDRLGATYLAAAALVAEQAVRAAAELAGPAELEVLAGQRVDHLTVAGRVYLERAKLCDKVDPRVHGQSLWQAADAFNRAGSRAEAVEALRGFIASQPLDVRVPEARFLLGQGLQAGGQYDEAIAVYQDNLQISQPPGRHAKAVEGLIPMAMCYVAKGPEFYGHAEGILDSIINDDRKVFTPDSEQYHSALYALGWLYHRQQKWTQAQKRFGEAIQRSPGSLADPGQADRPAQRERYCRATRAMFLTADSYHRSARELARQAQEETKLRLRRQLEQARDEQLKQADELYAQVIARVEQLDEPRAVLDETYRRNSYFARGDCLFELGRYEQAVDRYEQAIFHFQTHPAALGGLMQQHNCYVAMGRAEQARAALERARQLRRQIPEAAFASLDQANTPRAWDQWFDTVTALNPATATEELP